MKTMTIKKLDIMSVAKFAAALAGSVSLVMVVLSWALALIDYAKLNAYFPNVVDWNTGFGILAVIIVPIVYAAVGWVTGAVAAWFYNIALGAGGVKMEVE